jgi:hypothetical protein
MSGAPGALAAWAAAEAAVAATETPAATAAPTISLSLVSSCSLVGFSLACQAQSSRTVTVCVRSLLEEIMLPRLPHPTPRRPIARRSLVFAVLLVLVLTPPVPVPVRARGFGASGPRLGVRWREGSARGAAENVRASHVL